MPPPPPVSTAPLATDPQESPLRLSPDELKICKKWITAYSTLEMTEDRLKMLRGAILPQLAQVNTDMPEDVWKAHKLVSTLYPRVEQGINQPISKSRGGFRATYVAHQFNPGSHLSRRFH